MDKIEQENFAQREEAEAEAEAEAAALAAEEAEEEEEEEEEEADERGEKGQRYQILPYHRPAIAPVINPRPNIRRSSHHPSYPFYPHETNRQARPSRPQSAPYRRRINKRSLAGSGGVFGSVVDAGKNIMWLLKRVILKEVPKEAVAKEMKMIIDTLTEDLMLQLDVDGCLQKLMCHLQDKPKDNLTPEEDMMLLFFPIHHPHAACTDQHFPNCYLSAPKLDTLLTTTPKTASNIIP